MSDSRDEVKRAFGAAQELVWLRNKRPAIAALGRVLELDPEHARALAQLSMCHRILGDHARALELADRSLECDPNSGYAIVQRGWALYLLDRDRDALQESQRVLRLDPESSAAWELLGYASLALRRYDTARSAAEQMVRIQPMDEDGYVLLGLAHLGDGDAEAARDRFTRALEIEPDCPLAHRGLSDVALLEGDPEAALEAVLEAARIDPDSHDESYEYNVVGGPLRLVRQAIVPDHGRRRPPMGVGLVVAIVMQYLITLGSIIEAGGHAADLVLWASALPLGVLAPVVVLDRFVPLALRARVASTWLVATVLMLAAVDFRPPNAAAYTAVIALVLAATIRAAGQTAFRGVALRTSLADRLAGEAPEEAAAGRAQLEEAFRLLRAGEADDAQRAFGGLAKEASLAREERQDARAGALLAWAPSLALVLADATSNSFWRRAGSSWTRARDVTAYVGAALVPVAAVRIVGAANPLAALLPLVGSLLVNCTVLACSPRPPVSRLDSASSALMWLFVLYYVA